MVLFAAQRQFECSSRSLLPANRKVLGRGGLNTFSPAASGTMVGLSDEWDSAPMQHARKSLDS